MTSAEALRAVKGTRVVHVPTGEMGTVVRIEMRVRGFNHGNERRNVVIAIVVTPDAPTWMNEVRYWASNTPGRKMSSLQFVHALRTV